MDWNAIGAIGEVVGATGVIATLIYLSVQIRQNTKAVRGAALDAITERKQFELKWSSEIAGAFRKSIENPAALADEESWQLTEWMTAAFVARQNEYFQYKNGLIDNDKDFSFVSIRSLCGRALCCGAGGSGLLRTGLCSGIRAVSRATFTRPGAGAIRAWHREYRRHRNQWRVHS